MSVNALGSPCGEVFVDEGRSQAGLETEGVAAEVDAGLRGALAGGGVLGGCVRILSAIGPLVATGG